MEVHCAETPAPVPEGRDPKGRLGAEGQLVQRWRLREMNDSPSDMSRAGRGPSCVLILVPCLWAPSYLETCKRLADRRDGFHLNTEHPPACFHMLQSLRITPLPPFARNRCLSSNCLLPHAQGFSHHSWDGNGLGSRPTFQVAYELYG